MPPARPADVTLVIAYVRTGRTKIAAESLGMSDAAYRCRLNRAYRRHGVHGMSQLIRVMGLTATQSARLSDAVALATLDTVNGTRSSQLAPTSLGAHRDARSVAARSERHRSTSSDACATPRAH